MNPPSGNIYRFSKRCWLEESLKCGRFRLVPASTYETIENDEARQDNERERILVIPKEVSTVTCIRTGRNIQLKSDVTHKTYIDTDYYVVCFSRYSLPYLFDEFEGSDSYLEISNFPIFEELFCNAAELLLPGWCVWGGDVVYGGESPLGPFFQKPFKYLQQLEWRCVIIPPTAQEKLKPLLIDVGTLFEIATIVDKPKSG